MKTTIFNSELNSYARKFLVINREAASLSPQEFIEETKSIESLLFENFLLFDATSFKVFGENIPLALLLKLFGTKGVEALIEQEALEFVLWNPLVLHTVDNIPGVDPLCHGNLSSPAHSDPEESVKLGFEWMVNQPKDADKKNLIRKVRDIYSMPDKDLSSKAVAFSKSAYDSGKLSVYGLSPEITSFREIDLQGRQKLSKCADEILQYTHMLSNNMSSYSNFEYYQVFNDSNKKILNALNMKDDFKELSKLENIPDFRDIYAAIPNPFDQVLSLRRKGSSKKFRSWMANCTDSSDGLQITKEYVDAIANSKGFLQTKRGRFTKNVALSAVGAGVGMLIAGPVGAFGGAGVVKLLEPAADFGLDMLDEFVLSGLAKGWTPKIFFDDLSKLEISRKSSD